MDTSEVDVERSSTRRLVNQHHSHRCHPCDQPGQHCDVCATHAEVCIGCVRGALGGHAKRCAVFEWAVADLPVRHDLNVYIKEIMPRERLRFRRKQRRVATQSRKNFEFGEAARNSGAVQNSGVISKVLEVRIWYSPEKRLT